MALDTSPSREDMQAQVSETLFPAFVLGLVNKTGPIDDEDRAEAQRLLDVTKTREALDSAKLFTGPVSDEVWRIAQSRRKYAEAILRGELSKG